MPVQSPVGAAVESLPARDDRAPLRGLALLERLLTDSVSPFYALTEPLADALDRAREALLHHQHRVDLVSLALGLVCFALLLALVEGLERV